MKYSNNAINFTKAALLKLPAPEKGLTIIYDTQENGLNLYVTPKGHKSFTIQKRIQGKLRRIILGHFPIMSIEQARKATQIIKAEVANGKNPFAEKDKRSQEKTLAEACQMYIDRYAKIECKPSSLKVLDCTCKKIISYLGHKKLSEITRRDINELHGQIFEKYKSKYTANICVTYISSIYNKMKDWGWEGNNPASRIHKFKEDKRDRFVRQDEFPRLIEAFNMEPNRSIRDFFLMCLYTGARKSNILAMRWEDIDFNLKEWRIPDTKNGEPVHIPLLSGAIKILEDRAHIRNTSPWVFPSSSSKAGHLTDPQDPWKRAKKYAGIANLRIHDLRRTFASYQAIKGASLLTIGKTLGHKSLASTTRYAHLNKETERQSIIKGYSEFSHLLDL